MAEALFRAAAASRGLRGIEVDSAGLHAVTGHEAAPAAQAAARARGLDMSAHRARPLELAALGEGHLLVVMEQIHRRQILARARKLAPQVLLLGGFDPSGPEEIEDPYGGPDEAYEHCIERLRVCIDARATRIEREGIVRA